MEQKEIIEGNRPDKYKIVKWYNSQDKVIFFGIDCRINGEWYHVKDDEPLFFETEAKAKEELKKLKQSLTPKIDNNAVDKSK